MLVLARKRGYLFHLGGGNVTRIDSADAFALAMDLEHYHRGLLPTHGKKLLKHDNHEVHGREIIIQQCYSIKSRRPGPGALSFECGVASAQRLLCCHAPILMRFIVAATMAPTGE
jgi:hypothetical protein